MENYGSFNNVHAFAANCYCKLISNELSNSLQWKRKSRANDSRPGLSSFMNVLAVLGGTVFIFFFLFSKSNAIILSTVSVRLFQRKWTKDEVMTTLKLIETFQTLRKSKAAIFRKEKNVSPEDTAASMNRAPVDTNATPKSDGAVATELESNVRMLEKAVSNFTVPSG